MGRIIVLKIPHCGDIVEVLLLTAGDKDDKALPHPSTIICFSATYVLMPLQWQVAFKHSPGYCGIHLSKKEGTLSNPLLPTTVPFS